MPEPVLYFVYAVDGGLVASLRDYVHKIIRPASYPCRLCSLTYGPTGENGAWRCFVEKLRIKTRFLHRDEFRASHPQVAHELPVILLGEEVLLRNDEINACTSLEALIELVRTRVDSALGVRTAS